MRTPTPSELRLAALWCDSNEGDANEQEPLARVARWLEHQADNIEMRRMADHYGVPVKRMRAALAKAEAKAS